MNGYKSAMVTILFCMFVFGPAFAAADIDLTEQMKLSLVYLDVSAYSYNRMQPWRPADIVRKTGYGCAVGPYEILTTAFNAADAAHIKVRRYGQNEFIPATVKVIDYHSNLALLTLDKEAMDKPLKPLKFADDYKKNAELKSYWLSSGGHLTTSRGYLDRAEVAPSATSYARFLNYIVSDIASDTGRSRLYCLGKKPIGIACWVDPDVSEAGVIPAVIINRFLADAADGKYDGFASVGFSASRLLDPAKRDWLKMPDNIKHGVYVSKVHNLGTGSKMLKPNDVILSIDGKTLNPYGRFKHPRLDRISLQHLITSKEVGSKVKFEIWRDGKKQNLDITTTNFDGTDMLVPHYEHKEPEYIVTAGFVFQKMTKPYLSMWGDGWSGKVPSHLYHYYRDLAFKPSEERSDIVILSYVLPHPVNMGYQKLGRVIVKTVNGMEIGSLADIVEAQKLNPQSLFDVFEFEQYNPTVVIPRAGLGEIDRMIARTYGIGKLANLPQ
jgi:hypothetical protein